jgi:hypothetical protein
MLIRDSTSIRLLVWMAVVDVMHAGGHVPASDAASSHEAAREGGPDATDHEPLRLLHEINLEPAKVSPVSSREKRTGAVPETDNKL